MFGYCFRQSPHHTILQQADSRTGANVSEPRASAALSQSNLKLIMSACHLQVALNYALRLGVYSRTLWQRPPMRVTAGTPGGQILEDSGATFLDEFASLDL